MVFCVASNECAFKDSRKWDTNTMWLQCYVAKAGSLSTFDGTG